MRLRIPALLGNWTLRQSKVGEEKSSDKGCWTLSAYKIPTEREESIKNGTYRRAAVDGSSDFKIDSPGRARSGSPDDLELGEKGRLRVESVSGETS